MVRLDPLNSERCETTNTSLNFDSLPKVSVLAASVALFALPLMVRLDAAMRMFPEIDPSMRPDPTAPIKSPLMTALEMRFSANTYTSPSSSPVSSTVFPVITRVSF